MAVYMLIDITVREGDLYAQYVEKVREVVERHSGTSLARGGEGTVLSGDWHPGRLILIEFPTTDDLRTCFASPEYAALAPLRERSAVSRAIIVEGVAP